jgi:uroporphyrinogen decarboxylase
MIDRWPWKPAPDYTRLLKSLRRQGEPHYVPFLELFADFEMTASILGESVIPKAAQISDRKALEAGILQRIRFWHGLGYDAFWQGALLLLPGTHPLETADTAQLSRGMRTWVSERAGAITCWQDFERYPWPCASDADLHSLEFAARHLPEGMAMIGQISGILEPVTWLMGYETLALALYDQPALVDAMFAKVREIYVPLARALVQMEGVAALWMGDDMGFKTGTLVSPAHLRKYVFPVQKEIASIAHAASMPFLLHSCGNLEAVMEPLIEEVRIDAKHSFEDAIQPVEAFVEHYGDRVAAIGGVDMDLLARGSEEAVRARTRQILEACAASRGFVLGSGNSIANYIPPENFLAMLDEGWRYNERG